MHANLVSLVLQYMYTCTYASAPLVVLLYTLLIEPEGEEVRIFHTLQFCLCFVGRPIHISEDFMTMKYILHMFVICL